MYKTALSVLLTGASAASAALQVDFESSNSIKAAAKDVASDLMSYYKGNEPGEIPGLLSRAPPSGEFYWWTSAILWSTVIDYWHYTGDDTYNAVAAEGIKWQSGPGGVSDIPFLVVNQTATMSSDDLGLWGMTAMQAAELGFASASQEEPSWINLAKAVFEYHVRLYNTYLADEKDDTCNGGLRWQIPPTNLGHDYKNTMSTAVMLNLGARLYRYTGNQTYADWAEKTWSWLSGVGFIDDEFNVYDGAHVGFNCTDTNKAQFSYAAGVVAQAAAYMYNHTTETTQSTWLTRLTALTNRTLTVFFPETTTHTLHERACEGSPQRGSYRCNPDMRFFKGITLRALASVAYLAPPLRETLAANGLRDTAKAAVATCEGGKGGRECGFVWADAAEKKIVGPPEQMNVLSALVGVLGGEVEGKGLVTEGTAGTGGGGNGNGNGGGTGGSGAGSGGEAGAGNGGGSAGASMRVGMGLVLAGLFAALL